MKVCSTCNTHTDLVYSGVDAFLLQLDASQINSICYLCAYEQLRINLRNAELEKEEEQLCQKH